LVTSKSGSSKGSAPFLCDPLERTRARVVFLRFPCSFRQAPTAFSLHPTHPMIWGTRHPFRVPGKLHPVSLWLDISHGKTGGTFKAGNSGFFHLSEPHCNDIGKRTSNDLWTNHEVQSSFSSFSAGSHAHSQRECIKKTKRCANFPALWCSRAFSKSRVTAIRGEGANIALREVWRTSDASGDCDPYPDQLGLNP
jgi:hypothetical protein